MSRNDPVGRSQRRILIHRRSKIWISGRKPVFGRIQTCNFVVCGRSEPNGSFNQRIDHDHDDACIKGNAENANSLNLEKLEGTGVE